MKLSHPAAMSTGAATTCFPHVSHSRLHKDRTIDDTSVFSEVAFDTSYEADYAISI